MTAQWTRGGVGCAGVLFGPNGGKDNSAMERESSQGLVSFLFFFPFSDFFSKFETSIQILNHV